MVSANYYAYYVELTCAFVIACLPACKQLLGTKIWPEIKARAGYAAKSKTQGSSGRRTKITTTSISSPRGGTFQSRRWHLVTDDVTDEIQLVKVPEA